LRIFYYQEGPKAFSSFKQHVSSVDVIAPQVYSFNKNGVLRGQINPKLLAFAQKNNVKIMPLVTNGSFAQQSLQVLLNNGDKQDAAIAMLVNEAHQQNLWGWQIDFEQMDYSYRDKFSMFVKKFGDTLKKEGLVASVAVIAQVSENPSDYPKNLWQRIIGVYDYRSLGSSTDFLSIMSYDDPNSTGPVAGYPWLERVLAYSLSVVPSNKVSLGLPLYYWQWNTDSGKIVGIGGYQGIKKILKKHQITKGYNEVEQAPFISYTNKKGNYTVWYEDKKSINKKIELIKKNNLSGFSAWAIGLEEPSVYLSMKNE